MKLPDDLSERIAAFIGDSPHPPAAMGAVIRCARRFAVDEWKGRRDVPPGRVVEIACAPTQEVLRLEIPLQQDAGAADIKRATAYDRGRG